MNTGTINYRHRQAAFPESCGGKSMSRRIPFILLAAVLCLFLFTGCGKAISGHRTTGRDGTQETAGSGRLFDKPVTLRLLTPTHPSWPYQADWYVVKALKDKLNVSFEIITVNHADMREKINVTIASGDIPELVFDFDITTSQRYGYDGAYADILDHKAALPVFSKWMDENREYIKDYISADGSLYIMPDQGISETDRMGWLYRKDIFDRHGLKVPENDAEFYDVCKKLKEFYPDSYPFACKDLADLEKFHWLSSSWGTIFPNDNGYLYLDGNRQWQFGGNHENLKDCLIFYNRLFAEGLMPPDTFSMSTKAWQDLIYTGSAFITFDYLGRMDFFNFTMRRADPEVTFAYMPPWKGGANGEARVAYSAYAGSGFSLAANSPLLDEALKYMDWMYTDEAKQLLSWGEEGKTFSFENGGKKFIGVSDVDDLRKKYGLSVNGFYALFDYDAHASFFTGELNDAINTSKKYDMPAIPRLAFTEQELNIIAEKYDLIRKHYKENISRFLLGTRPFSEYNAYVREIEELDIKEVKKIYEAAYKRRLNK